MAAREVEGGPSPPSRVQSAISENLPYILRIGKALLLGFIKSLWQKFGGQHAATGEQLGGENTLTEQLDGEDIPDSPQITSLREWMLRIWQELSNEPEINSMVQSVAGEDPLRALAEVSEHTFATGINWGRIVTFFYFTYRVIAQSSPDWFSRVIDWAMGFLQERLAVWIEQQGGWTAMFRYNPFSR
ncbi:apoptosis regulator BAX-like isoform X2 [Hemicordylus capensis]|uniref:apoptosis regulator BAX-like isoform X2 n=1 Tax=Hemicordylus capensis TaxID=884348 RepID=UPI0023026B59|nr:apoptosis regulator BAX-like isoform X2 [Hemicordylus capensis]